MYSLERLVRQVWQRKREGLLALSLSHLLRQMAMGMVSMFGVVFVYQLGNEFWQGLSYVVLFFAGQRLVTLVMVGVVGELTAKIGYRWTMLGGLAALALKLLFLIEVSETNLVPLYPAVFFGGVAIAAYWLAYHALFLDDNDDGQVGGQMGILTLIERGAMMVAPLLAGILIEGFGFGVMFAVAMGLIVLAVVPILFMSRHERHGGDYSLGKSLKLLLKRGDFSWSVGWWQVQDGIKTFFWLLIMPTASIRHLECPCLPVLLMSIFFIV